MVCDDIAGTKVLGFPSEYFIKVIESIGRVPSNEMERLITDAYSKGKTENGISAVKIMSNQIKPIGKALKDASICIQDNKEECFYQFFKDAVFVRVIRNDKVAQAVSRVMARQTNIYHVVDNLVSQESTFGKVSKKRDESIAHYDFLEIKKEVENIKYEESFLDTFIDNFELGVESLSYEEVVKKRSYIDKVAFILNINDVQLAERRLKKVSGIIAEEWIERYKNTIAENTGSGACE